MAEIIINVNQQSSYEDGDVLCAFNDRSVQCAHAQHILLPHTFLQFLY